MAISDKTNVVIKGYKRSKIPIYEEGIRQYFQNELQRIEIAINSLEQAATQVADNPPENPIKGMVRYAISPWDPLGNGFSGLVVYNGTAWAAV